MVVSLEALDKDAFISILREPKNAITKQFMSLLRMDGVELEFDDGAVGAIAERAITIGAGARGLRSIMEEIMQPVMYDVPSDGDITKIIITGETVNGGKPEIIRNQQMAVNK